MNILKISFQYSSYNGKETPFRSGQDKTTSSKQTHSSYVRKEIKTQVIFWMLFAYVLLELIWTHECSRINYTILWKFISLLFQNFYVKTGTNLHWAATLAVDSSVIAAATKLEDHKLLPKLAAGDMHHASQLFIIESERSNLWKNKIMNPRRLLLWQNLLCRRGSKANRFSVVRFGKS